MWETIRLKFITQMPPQTVDGTPAAPPLESWSLSTLPTQISANQSANWLEIQTANINSL